MTSDEVFDLLEVIAACDRRTVGESDADVWEALVGDLELNDARIAVLAHYRESREFVMPADIRQRVKDMQIQRLERTPVPPPPAELTDNPQAYIAALRGSAQQIASGTA